jgi:outer membrane protein, multidrug efflux system
MKSKVLCEVVDSSAAWTSVRVPLLTLLTCALLSAGCATKTAPTRAEIQQQSATISALAPTSAWKAGGVDGSIADNWLASFNDTQLDALVREAVANNPDLRVAATRVEQASQYVELSKAALRPTVNLLGTGGYKASSGGDAISALQGIIIAASWELDLWGRVRYGRNAAQETYASTQADFEFARQSLAATTARSWFRDAPESGRRQRTGCHAGARQPRQFPGQRCTNQIGPRANSARAGIVAGALSCR